MSQLSMTYNDIKNPERNNNVRKLNQAREWPQDKTALVQENPKTRHPNLLCISNYHLLVVWRVWMSCCELVAHGWLQLDPTLYNMPKLHTKTIWEVPCYGGEQSWHIPDGRYEFVEEYISSTWGSIQEDCRSESCNMCLLERHIVYQLVCFSKD